MDETSNHLFVIPEPQEAQPLHDHLHDSSDLASARQINLSQLAEVHDQHQIEETTRAEIATSTASTCLSCEEPVTAETAYRAPCEHWYCQSCLEQLFRTVLVHESLYPPKCCVALPWDEVKEQLPRRLWLDSKRRMTELNVPASERVYCAQQACSLFLGDKRVLGGTVKCPQCRLDTCTLCKSISHAEPCSTEPDEETQQTLRLASEQGWQMCQECGRVVDLIPGGCNHMTCTCGYQFCYVCGERWRTCECVRHDLLGAHEQIENIVHAAQEQVENIVTGITNEMQNIVADFAQLAADLRAADLTEAERRNVSGRLAGLREHVESMQQASIRQRQDNFARLDAFEARLQADIENEDDQRVFELLVQLRARLLPADVEAGVQDHGVLQE
jgi:hypothetical protein